MGKRYQVEVTTNALGNTWTPRGHRVHGTGASVLAAIPQASPPLEGFRVGLITDNTAVSNAHPCLGSLDTDAVAFPSP